MRKRNLRALLLLAGAGCLLPAVARTDVVPELWFPVGEKLTYRIYWGVLPVGTSVATTGWRNEDGRTVLAIRFRTRTNRLVESIYPVDDLLETIIDPVTFLPIRSIKRLSEGRYRADETVYFDHQKGVARWISHITGKRKKVPIEAETRDLISFMYVTRARSIRVGEVLRDRVMTDEKIYDLEVQALRRDPLKLPQLGRVPSIKLEPEAAFQGLFVRKGKMWVWVSDDERRVITRLVARVPVASISLWLTRVEIVQDADSTEDEGAWDDVEEEELIEDEPAS